MLSHLRFPLETLVLMLIFASLKALISMNTAQELMISKSPMVSIKLLINQWNSQ